MRLKTSLDAENIRSPVRISGTGKRTGGVPISRGHLYWILSNPIYVGRLRHKGQIHDGLHPAIIDLETWDRVQQKLESQTRPRRISQPDDHSFLAGKLYDDRGNRMSSSHASKGGRRWRYYVSRAALTGRKQDAGSIVRVPASEIENPITRAVGTHLAARAAIAIDDHHINHSVLAANQAIPQHEQTRGLRRDPATEDDIGTNPSAICVRRRWPSRVRRWPGIVVPHHDRRLPLLRTIHVPCVLPSLPRWNCRLRISLASPTTATFPVILAGRLPHWLFRGLLNVHSRCGPHGPLTPYGAFLSKCFRSFVAS